MTDASALQPDNAARVRYHGLDALRAVAMLMGLWLHASLLFAALPGMPDDGTPRSVTLSVVLAAIHGFRMQVFFVMAGFFASLLVDRRGWWAFGRNRTVRILVPFGAGMLTVVPLVSLLWPEANPSGGPSVAHLWFLRDLILLYAGAFVIAKLLGPVARKAGGARLRPAVAWLISSLWLPPILAIPAALFMLPIGGLDGGPGTFRLMPVWPSLTYYSLFFACGWALYWCRERLMDLTRGWLLWTLTGLLAVFPLVLTFVSNQEGMGHGLRVLGAYVYGLYSMAMVVGLTGLFLRWCNTHSRVWRYVSDASYWLYLIHLPVQIYASVVVFIVLAVLRDALGVTPPWPEEITALGGCAAVLLLTTPLMVLSYHWLVRPTFIGRVLNGRRPGAHTGHAPTAPPPGHV